MRQDRFDHRRIIRIKPIGKFVVLGGKPLWMAIRARGGELEIVLLKVIRIFLESGIIHSAMLIHKAL